MKKFKFDKEVKKGDYLADYFIKTKEIVSKYKPDEVVTMQFFQRNDNIVLCGINQVLDLIKYASKNYKDLEVEALLDGEVINNLEPVLKISGRYEDFGFLEGMIDGILSRQSSIATNAKKVIELVGSNRAIDMNDRAELYVNQPYDGAAAYVGGFRNFVSKAALEYIDDPKVESPIGTMPHALIQIFNGDLIAATQAFVDTYPDVPLTALVDYNNDCVNDAVLVAKAFPQLKAVRIDTANNMIDKYLEAHKKDYPKNANLYGVNEYLVREVRKALDDNDFKHVKIIVSSGFTPEKIAEFEKNNVPVDIYGIGQALAKVNVNFTGDSVLLNFKDQAKAGRKDIKNAKLKKIEW